MPWYSAGTVAVTNNSATVTGTGTAFSANARTGDAFRGPDGRWYEITNIASATVLSITPSYQGATASGQAYTIAPMQGYVKESADRLRQLVDQFGSQLAALQPWATSATPAAALEALGAAPLESPALTGNPTAPTPAADDADTSIATTAHVRAAMGLFGLGAERVYSGDLNGLITPGLYSVTAGSTNWPFVQSGGTLIALMHGGGDYASQLALSVTDSGILKRAKVGASWSEWREVFHTGNILGTVSQSGGVPTGAIIERGSNANGEYVRFADGTQICSRSVDFHGDGPRETYVEYTWPAAFANTNYTVELTPNSYGYLVTNIKPSAKSVQALSKTVSTNSSSITVSAGGGFTVNVTATGRWY